jgi:hypothetical protein
MGDMPELVDGLTLTALIAGTLEYAILMRHRELRRYDLRLDESIAEAGLRALVRVVLIEGQTAERRRRRLLHMRRPSAQPLTRRLAASRRYLSRIASLTR